MSRSLKELSNPFSSGGGGVIFETHVQAAFAVLMLAGGYAPCLLGRSILSNFIEDSAQKICLKTWQSGYLLKIGK